MLKRTLLFSSPARIQVKDRQLLYVARDETGQELQKTIPIEEIGIVVIESLQITLTSYLFNELIKNNCCIIFCDEHHLPSAQIHPFCANTLSQRNVTSQLEATEALCNALWQQTIQAKICNQATCLERLAKPSGPLRYLAKNVNRGDSTNTEAVAARYYFETIGGNGFDRRNEKIIPNSALNYGYALLRATTARALVASGLLCIKGIHHCNQYNAYCLADDIMEPYRPFIDELVFSNLSHFTEELTKQQKAILLQGLTQDVQIGNCRRPLLHAISFTTASLARCFLKEEKNIVYPIFPTSGVSNGGI